MFSTSKMQKICRIKKNCIFFQELAEKKTTFQQSESDCKTTSQTCISLNTEAKCNDRKHCSLELLTSVQIATNHEERNIFRDPGLFWTFP